MRDDNGVPFTLSGANALQFEHRVGKTVTYGYAVTIRREGDNRLYYLTALYPTQLPPAEIIELTPATAAPSAGWGLTHDEAMTVALAEAERAAAEGEVPVGAVVIADGRMVARRHNDPNRVTTRPRTPRSWRCTTRPPRSGAGAPRRDPRGHARAVPDVRRRARGGPGGRVVFGAADPQAGACGSLYNLCVDPRMNHEVTVTRRCAGRRGGPLLERFFAERRDRDR